MKDGRRKRYLCFALSMLLVAGLAGCAGSAPSTGADVATSQAAVDALSPPVPGGYIEEDDLAPDDGWRYAPLDPEEEYDDSPETPFKDVLTSPLSTLSSDVDTASYSNLRRFITNGMQPEGVRIEELVNYFSYDYPRPANGEQHPFTVTSEVAPCPWNENHLLAMIGVQGAQIDKSELVGSNIVLLLDVSGSMNDANKLPLLQQSFKLLVGQLDENDRVSIVTYAGSDEIVADSVPGDRHKALKKLIDELYAGGSTAGAQGLRTAYALAEKNYIEGGNNRIILATDGDFNVGESSDEAMIKLIEAQRDKGIFISVLGFGMYNLKDSKMESIADNGNGNYAYIDTLEEAKKVLVDEFDSTMYTIAKDLKLQVEFNPAVVAQYRLIGYNNRRLENEDFANDAKDAGDIGAGHSVTAFYELVPVGAQDEQSGAGLTYQTQSPTGSSDFMTVNLRYKQPDGDESILVQHVVPATDYTEEVSEDFGFASAVVEFGLIVSDSQHKGESQLSAVVQRARRCCGRDEYGLRAEFVELVRMYGELAGD